MFLCAIFVQNSVEDTEELGSHQLGLVDSPERTAQLICTAPLSHFIMRIFLFLLVALALAGFDQQPPEDGWAAFARVAFKSTFFKEYDEYYLVPNFDSSIRAKEGKQLIIRGHYMPFELPDNALIVSKYPYAACFFCGGAGPESVAEVYLTSKPPKLKVDQVIVVKGKLRLNNTDINHMNFILEEAEIIN